MKFDTSGEKNRHQDVCGVAKTPCKFAPICTKAYNVLYDYERHLKEKHGQTQDQIKGNLKHLFSCDYP